MNGCELWAAGPAKCVSNVWQQVLECLWPEQLE